MRTNDSFRRMAGSTAALSTLVAFGSAILMLRAVNFDFAAVSDPLAILAAGARSAELWRWSMICDMLGYYLMIIPIVMSLRHWLGQRNPRWAELFGTCLLWYSLIGAIGASIHAAALPLLMRPYTGATAMQQETLRVVFLNVFALVSDGLWNMLEVLLAGIGWLGMGILLLRERRLLGGTTVVLGLVSLADGAGTIIGSGGLAYVGLMVYIFLAPLWALWIGLDLFRRPTELNAHPQGAQVSRSQATLAAEVPSR